MRVTMQPLHEGFIKESKNGIIYSPRDDVKPINPPPKMKAEKVKEPLCYNDDDDCTSKEPVLYSVKLMRVIL